jgi:hypothetical protein
MKHYEVQHYTLCQGWTNTWLIDDKPQTFATRKEAERELAEFLADIQAEIDTNEREPDNGYDASEFRIVEVNQHANP